MSTWNAQDEPTDPDPTVPVPFVANESWLDYARRNGIADRGGWVEEHGPLLFLDAIAIVGCSAVLAKAVGLL